MILFWAKSEKVLALTQLLCILIFLIGSIHHCLTLFYEVVMFVVKLMREMCKTKKIQPKDCSKNEKVEEKGPEIVEKGNLKRESSEYRQNKKMKIPKDNRNKNHLAVQFSE